MKVLNLKSYQKKKTSLYLLKMVLKAVENFSFPCFLFLCVKSVCMLGMSGSVLTCISMQAPRGLASADEGESHCLHSLHKAETWSSLM